MPKPNFTMRLDPEIRALAERIGAAERRSITSLIEVSILEYAKTHGFLPESPTETDITDE